jgi:hypothetical protein
MLTRLTVASVFALLLSGCIANLLPGDWYNTRPYRVAGANTPEDRERVKAILASIATKLHFVAAPAPPDVPGMFAFYRSAAHEEFTSYVGAHSHGDSVVVAVDATFGPRLASVERADRLLSRELRRQFGSRVTEFRDWKHSFSLRRIRQKGI